MYICKCESDVHYSVKSFHHAQKKECKIAWKLSRINNGKEVRNGWASGENEAVMGVKKKGPQARDEELLPSMMNASCSFGNLAIVKTFLVEFILITISRLQIWIRFPL